jgi:hypothetical protein
MTEMKAESGKFAITGGTVAFALHQRLPPEHPIHSLIGQIASDWAAVEHLLDLIIWQLAKLDEETGACITAQVMGSFPRMLTIIALCERRGLDASILNQARDLVGKMKGPQDRRNRILHDAWFVEANSGQTEQFKSMAKEELLYGFHPVDEAYVRETLAKIGRRIEMAGKLRNAIMDALSSSP